MKTFITTLSAVFLFSAAFAQNNAKSDSLVIRQIFDEALVNGESYSNLESLCKDVGHRLSGSPEAEKAVLWGHDVMNKMNLDSSYLQEITVPFWVRGDKEEALMNGKKLAITTLGGSVGTNGVLTAQVVEVQGIEDLEKLGKEKIEGKIVFFNRPMDPRPISTFESYGGCVDQRYAGASSAAEYGAKAVLVRSMTLLEDNEHPHTGSMGYKEGIDKIPAVALSTRDANQLHLALTQKEKVEVKLNVNAHTNDDVKSYNVIGEIKGSKYPDQVIVIGGHLDSWDLGEGAHDDGAGVVHSMEVLRIMKAINYQPLHTIRVVLFMNEENGNMGGRSYAAIAKESNTNHVVAMESDRGGFSPRGFAIKADSTDTEFVQSFKNLLEPYGLHYFEPGFPGVDISPLSIPDNEVNSKMISLGLIPDSQRYFDFHHCADDVFENVNKRELELGCGSMTAMVYLLDKYLGQRGI